jgi:hypothetical protein
VLVWVEDADAAMAALLLLLLVVALRNSAIRYCTALSKVCKNTAGAGAGPGAASAALPLLDASEEDEGAPPGAGEPGRLLLLPPRAASAVAAVRLWFGCGLWVWLWIGWLATGKQTAVIDQTKSKRKKKETLLVP